MAAELTDTDIDHFRHRLQARLTELRQDVRDEVIRADHEHFSDVAGEVHDDEEASVAHLVIDVDLASIDRHVHEIQATEAALLRIGRGEYGLCIDCDQPIGRARLEANSAAERCIVCQTAYERQEAMSRHPTNG